MSAYTTRLEFDTAGRGFRDIGAEVQAAVRESGVASGLCHLFIRHTSVASEVDEDTFFHSTETGGTVISTAYEEMLKVVKERYPVEDWNIYGAQASDGANDFADMVKCIDMLDEEILPLCQYFAYIEVGAAISESIIWSGFEPITKYKAHFAMRRVSAPDEIYPVFHELFSNSEKT